VCEPECPWEAIFENTAVPDFFKDDIKLNECILNVKNEFHVPEAKETDSPTPEQVAENRNKWGLGA
jgi:ferredoxin